MPRPATGAGQFEVVPRTVSQRRPAREEPESDGSEGETEESSESRLLGATDSETTSGSPDDDGGDSDESGSTEPEDQLRKRVRRV